MKKVNKKIITIVLIAIVIIAMVLMYVLGRTTSSQTETTQIASEGMMKWKVGEAGTYTAGQEITITLKGIDKNGIKSSSLSEDNITVLLDGVVDTPSTKEVTEKQASGEYASYEIKLSGFTRTGNVSLKIASGTLTDNSNKINAESYIATGITITNADGTLNKTITGIGQFKCIYSGYDYRGWTYEKQSTEIDVSQYRKLRFSKNGSL